MRNFYAFELRVFSALIKKTDCLLESNIFELPT